MTNQEIQDIKDAVTAAIKDAKEAGFDPYRTTIYFLAGLIAFCLSVIVGIFNAFPDAPVDRISPTYRVLGGVLAWISITALFATFCSLAAQILKYCYRVKQKQGMPAAPWWGWLALLMGLPALSGAIAVAYCVRAGVAILNSETELPGMLDALCKLMF